jgi:hypothetical protein
VIEIRDTDNGYGRQQASSGRDSLARLREGVASVALKSRKVSAHADRSFKYCVFFAFIITYGTYKINAEMSK